MDKVHEKLAEFFLRAGTINEIFSIQRFTSTQLCSTQSTKIWHSKAPSLKADKAHTYRDRAGQGAVSISAALKTKRRDECNLPREKHHHHWRCRRNRPDHRSPPA